MRSLQRHPLARLVTAAGAGAVVTVAAWAGGAVMLAGLLFLALTVVAFAALTLAPDAIALQQRHHWRWWWRSSDDEGPFWPGTQIPRGPRRP